MKPVTIVSPELPVNRFVILIPTSNKIKRFVEATVATTLCRHCFDKFANNYHWSTIKLVNRKELYFVPLHTRWRLRIIRKIWHLYSISMIVIKLPSCHLQCKLTSYLFFNWQKERKRVGVSKNSWEFLNTIGCIAGTPKYLLISNDEVKYSGNAKLFWC